MNKLYIQSYGCAMNFSDSEIVASILEKEGYTLTNELSDSDIVLINTCSIREKAEETRKLQEKTAKEHDVQDKKKLELVQEKLKLKTKKSDVGKKKIPIKKKPLTTKKK